MNFIIIKSNIFQPILVKGYEQGMSLLLQYNKFRFNIRGYAYLDKIKIIAFNGIITYETDDMEKLEKHYMDMPYTDILALEGDKYELEIGNYEFFKEDSYSAACLRYLCQ